MSPRVFELNVCGRTVVVASRDARVSTLVETVYGTMIRRECETDAVSIDFHVASTPSGFTFSAMNAEPVEVDDTDGFLYTFDKHLTIHLQLCRPDLYFLHGAALALGDRVVVLSAASGVGKSTTAFALTQSGFGYLSDELAPIDLVSLTVHPYPHALCLKAHPPAPYRLPTQTLDAGYTLHVPVRSLPQTVDTPLPVGAFVFLRRGERPTPASLHKLSPATVAAHLTSNALNALAHPKAGLEAVSAIAGAVPGYELDTSDLVGACRAIKDVFENDGRDR